MILTRVPMLKTWSASQSLWLRVLLFVVVGPSFAFVFCQSSTPSFLMTNARVKSRREIAISARVVHTIEFTTNGFTRSTRRTSPMYHILPLYRDAGAFRGSQGCWGTE